MKLVLTLALSGAAVFGQQIQTMAHQSATLANSKLLPVATIHSTKGLIVNGVRTPPGVTSAAVAPGDVISTSDGVSTAKFADGRTLSLAPGMSYLFPAPDRMVNGPITPVAVSSSNSARDLQPRLGVLSVHRP